MSFDTKFDRLTKAVDWSVRQMDKPRSERINAIRQFVGFHYGDDGSPKKVPVPLLKLAVNIYVRSLAARSPKVLVSTRFPELKPTAANLELAINDIPDEIKLTPVLRQIVTEALFSMGIAKIGLHTVGQVLGIEYGESFVDCVTLDDYIVDMSAKSYSQIQFEGNDYWLTRKQMEAAGWTKRDLALLDAAAEEETTVGDQGQERAESVAVDGSLESYEKRFHVRDLWLPDEELVVTYLAKSKKQLHRTEWTGPRFGPYIRLGFDNVPGNLLPLSPVSVWYDLHELANALFRKLGRQADKQKTVQGFQGGNDQDVTNFRDATDGDGITWSGAQPETLTAGGVDAKTLAFFMQVKELASYFGGNLDALGGLSPQAETLGQDKLLTESAGAQLRDMQAMTADFTREVFRSLAFYEWNDPVKTRTLEKRAPGLEHIPLTVTWNHQSRVGSLDEYDLDIDVYTMLDDSPSLKLQRLGYIMDKYIGTLLPEIQRQGGMVDVQEIFSLVAKLADFEELNKIVQFSTEASQPQEGQQVPGPNQTQRTYERVSRPGATPRGKSDAMQRILLGEKLQPSEAGVLG
jgi:hypothetical protein